jgi:hypothetical protein
MKALDFVIGYATIKPLMGHAVASNPGNFSQASVGMDWFRHADTTVMVWEPSGGVGHAAIMIGDAPSRHGPTKTDFYASWFPGGAGVSGKRDIVRDLAKVACSYEDDCLSEGDGRGGYRIPEHQICVPGLNTAAMHAEWVSTRNNDAIYNLLQNNCSTIAARILRAGMSTFDSVKYAYFAHCVYWTPTDVKKFAMMLAP